MCSKLLVLLALAVIVAYALRRKPRIVWRMKLHIAVPKMARFDEPEQLFV